jgi:hypothetical protein
MRISGNNVKRLRAYQHGRSQQRTHVSTDPLKRRRRKPSFSRGITAENFRDARAGFLTLSFVHYGARRP